MQPQQVLFWLARNLAALAVFVAALVVLVPLYAIVGLFVGGSGNADAMKAADAEREADPYQRGYF